MRAEVLALVVSVGAATWAFRYLPFRLNLSALSAGGWPGRMLAATGPAAIAALFAVSVLPLLTGGAQAAFWAGTAAVIGLWFWRRSVVLATLGGALAYGVVFAI
jgi:branched-subunit amino acid transport protein